MKICKMLGLFLLVAVFLLNNPAAKAENANTVSAAKFSQEELVNLSGPSVVRIVQYLKGEAVFKPFKLDLDNLTISSDVGPVKRIPVDEYMTGSGFIVSEDGYIMTNSHVISDQNIKSEIIAGVASAAVMDAAMFSLSFNEETTNSTKFEEFGEKINEYLLKEGAFNFEKKVVVLDPSSKKEKISDLILEGFPISVISVNENFSKDNWDMALIKIDQKNLPSLPFEQTKSVKKGEKIGVFGFPSTAELNDANLLESTFSQGVVSAIKESDKKDFDIIQTDAKISDGSSGSPLLNESGEVIGMITYQSNTVEGSGGDNFAFAIPIDVVQEGIKKFNTTDSEINFNQGSYNAQLSSGLVLLQAASCKKALTAFGNAKNINDKFGVNANIEPYIKKCENLVSAGQSIDTKWDKARIMLLSLDGWIWFTIGFTLLFFVAILIKFFTMKRRIKKDEKEIVILEEEIKENSQRDAEEMKEIKKIEKELEEMRNSKK